MNTREDRRAGLLLVGLAAAGLGVRVLTQGQSAPGGVLYRGELAVPSRDSLAALAADLARPLAAGERIDVDRASAQELTRLPRIGPGLATRIVEYRSANGPFGSTDALDSVPGIGPSVLRDLRAHVSFSGQPRRGRGPRFPARVMLNTASVEELAQLPGIGPRRARAIVEFRRLHGPFKSVDGLERVSGIGPATVQRLRGLVAP